MKRLVSFGLLFIAAFLSATRSHAQDLAHYLRLRNQYHVDHASDSDALARLTGTRVIELAGTVNGSFTVGALTTLLLDRPGGAAQEIETDFVPDWLVSSGISARLLVKAICPNEATPLRVVLLAATRDADIAKIEAAAAAKYAAAHPKKSSPSAPSRFAFRGDGTLYGSIGRGGSRMERRRPWSLPAEQLPPYYAAFIRRMNPHIGESEAMLMARHIVDRCVQFGIDPLLVMSIVLVESGFDPASVSHSGAIGLGQLMPGTAQWMGVSDSYDITQNIYGMVKLLRTLYVMFAKQSSSVNETWEKTLAAYNAGDGAVRRYGGVPPYPGVQAYVRRVLSLYLTLSGHSAG